MKRFSARTLVVDRLEGTIAEGQRIRNHANGASSNQTRLVRCRPRGPRPPRRERVVRGPLIVSVLYVGRRINGSDPS